MIARTLHPMSFLAVVLLSGCLATMATRRGQAQQPERGGLKAGQAAPDLPSAGYVIRRYVESVGGRAALMKLQSRYVWARFEFPARRLSGTLQIYAARPNKRVVKMEYPDLGTEITGFDGESGWRSVSGQKSVLVRGKELAELRDESLFDFPVRDEKDFKSIETVERTRYEGRECYKLRLVSASLLESIEFYDEASGLFAGSIRRRETEKGPVTVKTVVSKYKAFDGVRLPARITLRVAGTEEVITVMSVKHNRVNPSMFELPSRLRSRGPGA